jgi:ADP-ribose pyrophosphatase YjhB (NUDIX family)
MTPPGIVVGVGALVVDGDRVLLIERGHPPAQGSWSIPGGRVEVGETLPAALRREILEECGLEISVGDVAIVLDRIARAPDGAVLSHYLILDFWATPTGGTAIAGTDAAALGWFTLPEIQALTTTTNLAYYIEEALRRKAAGHGCLVVSD